MKHLRKLSLLLALAMLATTACGGGGDSEDTKGGNDTAPVSDTTPVETQVVLEVPNDLSSEYDVISFLTAESILAPPEELTDEVDVLGQAIYDSVMAVEEHFDIDLEFTGIVPWGDTSTMARQSINAGSDDYQFVFTCASHMVNLVNEGLFLPHAELPYIDIEKPWWNKQYIDSVSLVADEPYILFGDITYNTIQRTTCVFFNVQLLEEKLNMQPQDLYDIVYAGEWTIDKMAELVSGVYEDANGNTINDYDDIHGMVINGANQFNWMAFSSGIDFTDRDEDGYPTLNLNNETTIQLCDKLLAFMTNNPAVYKEADNHTHVWKFGNGKALFLQNRFFLTGWEQLRTMEQDYGILPMPKYDESIEGYHSTVESLVQWGGVPVTTIDPVFVSAVAEVYAYHGRDKITPAYYETTLKLKQTRDDASMEMLDMIMAGRDTDYLYINPLGGMNTVFNKVFNSSQNTFASQYASLEMAANATLQGLIEDYEELH